MDIQAVRDLFDYNYWANRHLLTVAAQLTPDQFTAPSAHSWGGVQGTLVHILDTEMGWRELLCGRPGAPELKPADFPTVDALQQGWQADEQIMRAYLDGLSDADLQGIIRYHTNTGALRERVLWHCLFHVVNHGMQHRSEVASMLTGYGHSPGDIDFTVFLNQRAGLE